jgi:hypothetical protein
VLLLPPQQVARLLQQRDRAQRRDLDAHARLRTSATN